MEPIEKFAYSAVLFEGEIGVPTEFTLEMNSLILYGQIEKKFKGLHWPFLRHHSPTNYDTSDTYTLYMHAQRKQKMMKWSMYFRNLGEV